MGLRIEDRVSLVTGASRGLGQAISERFALEGAKVVMAARNGEELEKEAKAIESQGGRVLPVQADVSKEEDVQRLFTRAREIFGEVDLLVNTVGYYFSKPLHEMTSEEWDKVLGTKVRAAFLCCRAALPGMLRRGRGHIINIASGGAKNGAANFTAFCASEFAVLGLTRSLAEEVRGKGVHVACLLPMGTIESAKTKARASGGDPTTWLERSDLVDAALYLATQGARALTTELIVRPPNPNYG